MERNEKTIGVEIMETQEEKMERLQKILREAGLEKIVITKK